MEIMTREKLNETLTDQITKLSHLTEAGRIDWKIGGDSSIYNENIKDVEHYVSYITSGGVLYKISIHRFMPNDGDIWYHFSIAMSNDDANVGIPIEKNTKLLSDIEGLKTSLIMREAMEVLFEKVRTFAYSEHDFMMSTILSDILNGIDTYTDSKEEYIYRH